MSDLSTGVRRPYQPSAYEQKILQFWRDRGTTGYDREIRDHTDAFMETVAEAGPGGNHCEFTQERLDRIDREIMETIQSATDRYEDLASDPLP